MMYGFGIGISPVNRLFSGGGGLNPLWDGLLAYYTADSTANDALGTYNGTLVNGATYGTGIINNGFSLDGVNDYVDLGNNLDFDGTTPFSISCWVNASVITGGTRLIFGKGNASRYWFYFLSTGEIGFMLYNNINELRVTTVDTFTTSTWYHLTVTYDGSRLASGVNIYVDNSDKTLITNVDTLVTSISNTDIAAIGSSIGTGRYFSGMIDEMGIWDRVLTPTEVTELYNSGAGLQY